MPIKAPIESKFDEARAGQIFDGLHAVIDYGMKQKDASAHFANSILAVVKLQTKLMLTYGAMNGRDELDKMLTTIYHDTLDQFDKENPKMQKAAKKAERKMTAKPRKRK